MIRGISLPLGNILGPLMPRRGSLLQESGGVRNKIVAIINIVLSSEDYLDVSFILEEVMKGILASTFYNL
jgi:hypothetical protein